MTIAAYVIASYIYIYMYLSLYIFTSTLGVTTYSNLILPVESSEDHAYSRAHTRLNFQLQILNIYMFQNIYTITYLCVHIYLS